MAANVGSQGNAPVISAMKKAKEMPIVTANRCFLVILISIVLVLLIESLSSGVVARLRDSLEGFGYTYEAMFCSVRCYHLRNISCLYTQVWTRNRPGNGVDELTVALRGVELSEE